MEFGKLANVDHVDWSLPADPPISLKFLNSLGDKNKTQYYIGAPMWGPKEWVGAIYPPGTKSADYLYHYSRNYNTIELNTTHYRIPTSEQAKLWISQVPQNFLFCPKILQTISHEALLDLNLLKSWWAFLDNLQSHLGPCFLQFPPNFTYRHKSLLHQFFKIWPNHYPLALEFRHPSWFDDQQILSGLTKYLQEKGIGLVITDVAGRRDVVHTSISAPYSMLRFIGNNLHGSDILRAKNWAQRIKVWNENGLQKMFVFVHEPENLPVLEMTEIMIHELNSQASAELKPLQWCNFLQKPSLSY